MLQRKIVVGTIIGVILLGIFVALGISIAFLTSSRNVEGYINFANGIEIEYNNIRESGSVGGLGNLYYLNTETGENENLALDDIQPGEQIKIANPSIKAKEGTASFALRAKLVITATNETGNYIFDNNDEYKLLTQTTSGDASQIMFSSGVISFNDNWELGEDGYYYFVTSGVEVLKDRVVEFDENSPEITVFDADADSEYLTVTIIDGEPIEKFNYSSLSFKLYLQAIQYSSLDVWFE